MSGVHVDTQRVVAVADELKRINREKLQKGFSPVKTAMTNLDKEWDGGAASAAMEAFNKIATNFEKDGYKVIDDFANFLVLQVSQGYQTTEQTNKKLADYFK